MRKKKKEYYYYTVHMRSSGTYIAITHFNFGKREHLTMIPSADNLLKILEEKNLIKHKVPDSSTKNIYEKDIITTKNIYGKSTITTKNISVENNNNDSVEKTTQESVKNSS